MNSEGLGIVRWPQKQLWPLPESQFLQWVGVGTPLRSLPTLPLLPILILWHHGSD